MKRLLLFVALVYVFVTAPCYALSAPTFIPTYEEINYQAFKNCKNRSSEKFEKIHHDMLRTMIEVEKSFGVPAELRGMLLAAACSESGYNPKAKGDYRISKRTGKKQARAIGILQQWPWYERYYEMDRSVPKQAMTSWMQHIYKQLPKVKTRCKIPSYKTKTLWVAAWVHAIRAPKEGGRCLETPLHYRILKKWHKNILKQRELDVQNQESRLPEEQHYIPGC